MTQLREAIEEARLHTEISQLLFPRIPVGGHVIATVEGVDGFEPQSLEWLNELYVFEYASLLQYQIQGVSLDQVRDVLFGDALFPGGARDPITIVPPNFLAFPSPVEGTIVPRGRQRHEFDMPGSTGFDEDLDPSLRAILRFRRRGQNTVAAEAFAGDGGATYTLQLANTDVVPGSVVIRGTIDGGGGDIFRLRDDGGSAFDRLAPTGRLGGLREDSGGDPTGAVGTDGTFDSTINYATGEIFIVFADNIVNAGAQIEVDYEYGSDRQPMGVKVQYDVDAA